MKKRYIILATVLVLILTGFESSYCKLDILIKPINGALSIDATDYPMFKAKVRFLQNGSDVVPAKTNLLIIENNTVAQPFSMQATGDGWYEARWYTRLRGQINPLYLIAVYNNETAETYGQYKRDDISQVRLSDAAGKEMDDYRFGSVSPGNNYSILSRVWALMAKNRPNGDEGNVMIDSVRVHDKAFGYEWIGYGSDQRRPPLDIIPANGYMLNIFYKPTTKDYVRSSVTVYYDGGLKEELDLVGGKFEIPTNEKVLKMVYPNGGEYFTPCQKVQLHWTGAVRLMPTEIELSTNGGNSWIGIGATMDSTFVWTVPNHITRNAIIRVKQSFSPTDARKLVIDNSPVTRIAFSFDGTTLLSANISGRITEWDVINFAPVAPQVDYLLKSQDNSYDIINSSGISYISNDNKKFAVVYRCPYQQYVQDTLAFFNVGTADPYLKIPIDIDFITRKLHIDNSRKLLVFEPYLGLKMKIYSLEQNKFLDDIIEPYPITSVSFSAKKPQAAIAQANGDVKILSVPDFNVLQTLDYSSLPMIVQMGFAPNGKFLAIGCDAPQGTTLSGNKNQIHVINLPTNQIIRSIRKTASNPVGLRFSPASTVLMIGSTEQPQISFWDLPIGEESFMGGLTGHMGSLTDFAFSPVGSTIATSSASADNLYIRSFSYSEADSTDRNFSIVFPKMHYKTENIPPVYIGESKDIELKSVLCNSDSSSVPIVLTNAYLKFATHYKLKALTFPDILNPGDCLSVSFVYFPQDTGSISDTLVFAHCTGEFKVPINSYCKGRHITFLNTVFDFGDLCMGAEVEKEITLARNDDPVPLKINAIEIADNIGLNFEMTSIIRDTILNPGESIKVKIKFAPKQMGAILNSIRIRHSDQWKYIPDTKLKGNGIGTTYYVSHEDLRFIPELPLRKLVIINDSKNDIFVQDYESVPAGWFMITTALPKSIKANSQDTIEIYWDISKGYPPSDVAFTIKAGPCAASKLINIGIYYGTSVLSLQNVNADPRGSAIIPVAFKNTENKPYKGTRFLDAEFSINPRMFLPELVTSQYGIGKITRNEIINDRRIVGFRIDGDFPLSGTVAEIKGIAGLAEIDTSNMNFVSNSIFWGKNINVTARGAVFKLINISSNRFVVQDKYLSNLSIFPNPSGVSLNAEFDCSEPGVCVIEIFDNLGNKIGKTITFDAQQGKNQVPINIDNLVSGFYKIIVKKNTSAVTAGFNVVK